MASETDDEEEFLLLEEEDIALRSSPYDELIARMLVLFYAGKANTKPFKEANKAAGFYQRFIKLKGAELKSLGYRLTNCKVHPMTTLAEKGYAQIVSIVKNEDSPSPESGGGENPFLAED